MSAFLRQAVLIFLISAIFCGAVSASDFWSIRQDKTSFSVSYAKRINENNGNTYNSFIADFKARVKISKKSFIVFKLPAVRDSFFTYEYNELGSYKRSIEDFHLTSPYIGGEYSFDNLPLFAEFGIRFKYLSKDSVDFYYGTITDFENFEAYKYKNSALILRMNYYKSGKIFYRIRLGLSFIGSNRARGYKRLDFAFKIGKKYNNKLHLSTGVIGQKQYGYTYFESTSTVAFIYKHFSPSIKLHLYTLSHIKPFYYTLRFGMTYTP